MKIQEEQIIEAYERFRDYYFENEKDFSDKKQAHIVKEVKQRTIQNSQYSWNNASLTDYIKTLIYMVKGEQFARTINKFSKKYLIENICKDFGEEICENAKRSLNQHEKYYAKIVERNKSIKNSFYGLWIPRSEDPQTIIKSGIWKNHLSNTERLDGQIEQLKIGDKVFLYQTIADVPTKETPFFSYASKGKYSLDGTLTKVKSWAIGVIKNIDLNTYQLEVEWDISYSTNKWYGYTRQDGVWAFEIDGSNTLQQRKYKKLYSIVFDREKQDYKWWFDNGILGKRIDEKKQSRKNIMKTKNIILYGSPGVGKTHNTNKLIQLIEDGNSDREIFDTIKNNEMSEGVELSDIKERVKFITFHQSFGYEDFIEGFRPNEEGNIELTKGIFREICFDAENNLLRSNKNSEITFLDAFNRLFKEKIENEESITFSLKRVGSFFKVHDYNDKTIYFEKQAGNTNHTLSIATLEKMYKAEKNDFINGGLAVYYQPILDKLLEIKKEITIEKEERKNFYLVIDEINRGNISKIFGELITLIEEDKRDKLEVTLPYSKQSFKIPSNLYIIGTMNSTDKSIALIDIALRRRFTFLKMQPNVALIENIQAKEIFEKLNQYITEKLGEDYQVGHSCFMGDIDLSFVLEYKIKPLLEEYFYGDTQGLKEVFELLEY